LISFFCHHGLRQLEDANIQIQPREKVHYLPEDSEATNKQEKVRAFSFVSADDFYDEEKYRGLLLGAAEESYAMDPDRSSRIQLDRLISILYINFKI